MNGEQWLGSVVSGGTLIAIGGWMGLIKRKIPIGRGKAYWITGIPAILWGGFLFVIGLAVFIPAINAYITHQIK